MIEKLNKNNLDEFLKLRIEMLMADSDINYDKEELERQTKDYFNENINTSLFAFGYKENEKIVAIACYEIIKRLPTPRVDNKNSDIGYICNVFTKENYRKKGYAKKLLEYMISDAKKRGIQRFQLRSHNPIAIQLYKQLGFEFDKSLMSKYE